MLKMPNFYKPNVSKSLVIHPWNERFLQATMKGAPKHAEKVASNIPKKAAFVEDLRSCDKRFIESKHPSVYLSFTYPCQCINLSILCESI